MTVTRRRSSIPGLFALLIMCSLILALGVWLFLPDLMQLMVQRLTPPVYPGVELLERTVRTEFGTSTEESTFRAHEQVYTVRAWMEQRMPGFATCVSDTSYLPDCSTNLVCDTGPISKAMIWLMLGEEGRHSRACVSVTIMAEPGNDQNAIIRYSVNWPAQETQSQ